uniref:Uncharacterized protein n=1 Tax=Oryza meridionalis TaxID=40149 RepID=A0A0E0DD39_9ORYZ
MANDGDTVAELAQLSGANLVRHLQTTNRMADYKVAAHVFGEHECRAAETEAYLQAKIDSLQMECDLLAKECAYSEGGKKTNIDSNINEVSGTNRSSSSSKRKRVNMDNMTIPLVLHKNPHCIGNIKSTKERGRPCKSSIKPAPTMSNDFNNLLPWLISMGGSPIAPAIVATSFASVADMSPPLADLWAYIVGEGEADRAARVWGGEAAGYVQPAEKEEGVPDPTLASPTLADHRRRRPSSLPPTSLSPRPLLEPVALSRGVGKGVRGNREGVRERRRAPGRRAGAESAPSVTVARGSTRVGGGEAAGPSTRGGTGKGERTICSNCSKTARSAPPLARAVAVRVLATVEPDPSGVWCVCDVNGERVRAWLRGGSERTRVGDSN